MDFKKYTNLFLNALGFEMSVLGDENILPSIRIGDITLIPLRTRLRENEDDSEETSYISSESEMRVYEIENEDQYSLIVKKHYVVSLLVR